MFTNNRIGMNSGPKGFTVRAMTKLIALFMAMLALIQFIKPLGLPGLKRRQDAWKLAVAGVGLMFLFILLTAGFK